MKPLASRACWGWGSGIWIKVKRRRQPPKSVLYWNTKTARGFCWGRALIAQDSLAAAREVLEDGLAQIADPEQAAEFHFELGSVALGERDYEAAERAFGAVLEGAPRRALQAAALFYSGHSLQARGEQAAARAAFEELVAAYPDQPQASEAEWLIGELYYEEQEYEQALASYERVFAIYPNSKDAPEALYGAAWCQLELERIEPMNDLFLRLVREYPQHERAHQGLMHIGDYYYNGHQFLKASRLYEQVVERFRGDGRGRASAPVVGLSGRCRSRLALQQRHGALRRRRVRAGHRGAGGGDCAIPQHAQRGGGPVQYRSVLLPDGQLAAGPR